MARRWWIGLVVLWATLPTMAVGFSGGIGVGLVGMEHLNGQLEVLAARQEAEFSPIHQAWYVQFAVWPWPQLGVGMRVFSTSGAIHNRMSGGAVFSGHGDRSVWVVPLARVRTASQNRGSAWGIRTGALRNLSYPLLFPRGHRQAKRQRPP